MAERALRILVVEDDIGQRDRILELLARPGAPSIGFQTHWVDSLQAASQFLRRIPCDAVLLNLKVEGVEDLSTFLQATTGETAVLVWTGLPGSSELRILSRLEPVRAGGADLAQRIRLAIERGDQQRAVPADRVGSESDRGRSPDVASTSADWMAIEHRGRLIEEASSDAIFTVTLDATVKSWNHAAEGLTGYRTEEMVGRKFFALLPESRRVEMLAVLDDIGHGQSIVGHETEWLTKQGTRLHVVLNMQPVLKQRVHPVAAVGAARDVSALKQLREQLRRRDAELAHVTRVSTVGEMAAVLAHELAQPLGAAANYAGSCIELTESGSANPEDLLGSLNQLTEQIQGSAEIVRRLRSFLSKAAPTNKAVDLNELVRDVDRMLPSYGLEGAVQRQLELDSNLPQIWADPIQIRQVLLNLIRNSLEALSGLPGTGYRVVIRTTVYEGMPMVSVSDNGRMVSEELLKRAFESYFTTKPDGLGMGLSICRTIIENHGGRIWAEPDPDGGAHFHFVLPAASEREISDGQTPS